MVNYLLSEGDQAHIMKSIAAFFFCLILHSSIQASDDFCTSVFKSDFNSVENIIHKKIRKAWRNKKDFENNWERLDSLQNWLKAQDCVDDAYWNKNDAFILITTTFVRSLAVRFKTKDSLVEKCYQIRTTKQMFGDWLFWRFGVDVSNNRLKYLGVQDCDGFIKQHYDVDSINAHNRKRDLHNYALRFNAERVSVYRGPHNYHPIEEGQPIYFKLTVRNASDTIHKFIWPLYQNDGRKIVYFELQDENQKRILLEDRNVVLPHNETIPYDIIEIKPGENKEFYHVIDGPCFNSNYPIECHHNLGLMLEGDYRINVWYDPFVANVGGDVWLPWEMDSMPFRGYTPINVVRSMAYNAQSRNLRFNREDVSNSDRSEVVLDLELLEGGNDYVFGNGQYAYDGVGIVKAVHKGQVRIGDTVAFSIRNEEDRNLIEKWKMGNLYRVYATLSAGKYNKIVLPASNHAYLKDQKNFQLINWKGSIVEVD